jgi:hypothetical protein
VSLYGLFIIAHRDNPNGKYLDNLPTGISLAGRWWWAHLAGPRSPEGSESVTFRELREKMATANDIFQRIRRVLIADEGATLFEAAVSLVILLSLLIGTMQICLALYASHFVADAAREASRYAIVRGSASCSTTPHVSNCNVTADGIQTWVRSLNYPGIDPTHLEATTAWPSSGSDCYPSTSPCNNPGNLVKIAVTYAFPLNIPFWKGRTIHLSSTSQMVISQ